MDDEILIPRDLGIEEDFEALLFWHISKMDPNLYERCASGEINIDEELDNLDPEEFRRMLLEGINARTWRSE